MDAQAGFPLRALGIGEIFDRAITIYVRNFVVFTLIILTVAVPIAVVQYFFVPDDMAAIQQVMQQIEHPGQAAKAHDAVQPEAPQRLFGMLTLLAVFGLMAPFANNAVAVGVAAVYFGKRPDYRNSYAAALRRWPSVLGTALVSALIVVAVYVAGAFAIAMMAVIGALLVRSVLPLAILLFILTLAGFIALILLLMVLVIMYAFGVYAVSIESVGVRRAITESFGRVFNRSEIGKAVLMGLAIVGIQLGVLSISGTVALLALFALKNYALQLAITAVTNAIVTAFVTVIFAVYYFDVRTRQEGLDLETDLARLSSA